MNSFRLSRHIVGLPMYLAAGVVLAASNITTPSLAIAIDDFRLEGSYGSGNNRVALVVDFPASSGDADSFAFEVRFDTATISGLGVLDAVMGGSGGNLSYALRPGYTNFIDTLTYGLHNVYCPPLTDDSLQYWVSNDGGQSWNDPTDPLVAWQPIDVLQLINNQTLGWTADTIHWAPDSEGNWYPTPSFNQWERPVVPLRTTPEPSTLALIISGLAALLLWRRWKK